MDDKFFNLTRVTIRPIATDAITTANGNSVITYVPMITILLCSSGLSSTG